MKKLIFLAIIAFASCKKDDTPAPTPAKTYSIQYKVETLDTIANGTYNVTYMNENGTQLTASNVSSGWTYSFTAKAGNYCWLAATATALHHSVKVSVISNSVSVSSASDEGTSLMAAYAHTDYTCPN